MPGGDRTGPDGSGPRTGRAAGFCSGYPMPGSMNMGPRGGRYGCGLGRGRGPGRGWRFRSAQTAPIWSPPSREDELAYLEDVRRSLEQGLDDVRRRLKELSEAAGSK